MQIDNYILIKHLGEGDFGEVYLTKRKGDNNNNLYATKKYEREKIEKSEAMKYLNNEIGILKSLNHPNIVKFVDFKKTKKHYYIMMEFCNGGELAKALEKYQLKYGKAFNEDLVQYIMRQIIDAFKYIHNKKMMHRDIKLENILLNFDNEQDRKNLNLMRAKVKIIDFGFAAILQNDGLKYTAIGNPINMDPLILKKLGGGKKYRQLGYDQKADIWSLGAICYQMVIGKPVFDAEDMEDLINKVETGKYKVPTSLSKEIVSFLNGMLQYDPNKRLDINQIANHQFIKNNTKEFHSIDLRQVSNKLDENKRKIVIDVKKNRSIWAIFNSDDEKKLINISPEQLRPMQETKERPRRASADQNPKKNMIQEGFPIRNVNTAKMKEPFNINNFNNMGMINPGYNLNYNNVIQQQNQINGPMLIPHMQGIPGNPYQNNNILPQIQYPMGGNISNAPTIESHYIVSGGIYRKK